MKLSGRERGLIFILCAAVFWTLAARLCLAGKYEEICALQYEVEALEEERKRIVLWEESGGEKAAQMLEKEFDAAETDRLLQRIAQKSGVFLHSVRWEKPDGESREMPRRAVCRMEVSGPADGLADMIDSIGRVIRGMRTEFADLTFSGQTGSGVVEAAVYYEGPAA